MIFFSLLAQGRGGPGMTTNVGQFFMLMLFLYALINYRSSYTYNHCIIFFILCFSFSPFMYQRPSETSWCPSCPWGSCSASAYWSSYCHNSCSCHDSSSRWCSVWHPVKSKQFAESVSIGTWSFNSASGQNVQESADRDYLWAEGNYWVKLSSPS